MKRPLPFLYHELSCGAFPSFSTIRQARALSKTYRQAIDPSWEFDRCKILEQDPPPSYSLHIFPYYELGILLNSL
uniref:Uncharacterized protein n=2 Tax=Picea TaxID=3328 RepID=A0A101M3I7_PICGL|nr:hypothetical protein ABT39_MTgene239 [Picea glauca]QHR90120.1 hypothetical protein Q903MT_gene4143 [Picea sitchensis]